MLRQVVWLCLLGAPPALAEVALGSFKTIDTRYGRVGVVWAEGREYVLWNTQKIPDLETAEITIAGGYALEGEAFDWVLFSTRHSGNMCPYGYVLAKVSAAGVARTQTFGECLGQALDLRVLPGRIEIDLGDSDIRYEKQTFVYTGDSFTKTAVAAAAPSQKAGSGAQVTRWAGKSLFDLLRDPGEVARFSAILSPKLLEDLRQATSLPEQSTIQGDWLIGTGCQPHLCNAVAGLWAIRISDGAPFGAFVYGDGAPISSHGDPSLLADPVLNAALARLNAKMSR